MQNEETNVEAPVGSKRGRLAGLVALNVALLVVLAAVMFGSSARAQARGRGEYTMVAGGVNGSDSDAVYIVDVANQELIAVTYSQGTKTIQGIGYRNLAQDAASRMRPTGRPSN
ncbi:MAG: hypothetical protein L0Y44_06860 [Phycisphaerales bacterium]|nr:hypothetical protein [Phycisphaerales bacterium]MCI0630360.1 hypothetical protein [Phycisphaerales bacterium]